MKTAPPTTTRDILGLALLATLSARPSPRTEATEAVRVLCLPWLTPTRDVITALVAEYCKTGYLRPGGDPSRTRSSGPSDRSRLELTPDGQGELRHLALHRTKQPPHHLALLCESLRFSVVGLYGAHVHAEILHGQIHARRRCLLLQRRRLLGAGGGNPVLASTLRHQITCAEAELDALVGAFCRMWGARELAARAEAEPGVISGVHRTDEGETAPLLPFSMT